jgi:transposase-like protein
MGMTPKTLADAIRHFSSFENCRDYMVARRWPNGVECPACGSKAVYYDHGRKGWECKTRHPKRKFTLKTGTIFEDSPLGLEKWLPVLWMIANCKNGVSSYEVHRAIGVTQKTAWFMLQRIRLAMQDEDSGGKLSGEVEVDETYIGGKARNMHAAKRKALMSTIREDGKPSKSNRWAGKVPVVGILERCTFGASRVKTMTVDNVKKHQMQSLVREHVEQGSEVMTDALHSYHGLKHDYDHQVVDHAECYAKGNVHTNGLESYWSLLKRALKGTYISVEPFHLFRYLDEQAFRFNERWGKDADRFELLLKAVVGRRLTWKTLTGAMDAGTI